MELRFDSSLGCTWHKTISLKFITLDYDCLELNVLNVLQAIARYSFVAIGETDC